MLQLCYLFIMYTSINAQKNLELHSRCSLVPLIVIYIHFYSKFEKKWLLFRTLTFPWVRTVRNGWPEWGGSLKCLNSVNIFMMFSELLYNVWYSVSCSVMILMILVAIASSSCMSGKEALPRYASVASVTSLRSEGHSPLEFSVVWKDCSRQWNSSDV